MSQEIGLNFKTRIPTFGDDASIEEALKVYHYGVDNYTIGDADPKSIEGHFKSLDERLDTVETLVSGGLTGFVRTISLSSSPNIITSQTISTIPITVRAIASQTSALQEWQNSSSSTVAKVSAGGYITTLSYFGVGTLTETSSIAANINIIGSSHKGIVVKGSPGQTGNFQEWQNSSGTSLATIFSEGSLSSSGYASFGSITQSINTAVDIRTKNATHKGLTVRSFSSQSANLQEWQNSSGAALSLINSSGGFASMGYASLGSLTVSSTTSLFTNILNSSHTGIIVKAAENQSANLQEWQDFNGNILSYIRNDGTLFIKNNEITPAAGIDPFLLIGA